MSTGPQCDLCSLNCGPHPFKQLVGEVDRFFCCAGCMNVYLILWESGSIQAGQDIRQNELFQRSLQLGLISQAQSTIEKTPGQEHASLETEELILRVGGMWCTSCAWLIEHALASLTGIVSAEVSFASDLVKVRYAPQALPQERIAARIESFGYRTTACEDETDAASAEQRDLFIRTGLAAFLWANIMSFSLVLYAGYFEQISGSVRRGLPYLLMVLATPVVFYCALPILRLAWRGLLHGTLRMESLLSLGILAAYGYSVVQAFRGEIHLYFDTATVIVVFVLLGKLIEHGAKAQTSRWIGALHRMMPNKARLLSGDTERFVAIEALEPGALFMVKAGERIPADGLVIKGESHADESLLTGESHPVSKSAGKAVVAGSINLDGVLTIQAVRTANDSTLSGIIAMVEHALSSRGQLERTVDRVARIFVPCVIVIALLTFAITWGTGAHGLGQSLMRAITVLVIACPCALGLATPLAMVAAFGVASRQGILVRDSGVFEGLKKIDTVILDKTGTVTEGKFSLLELTDCHIHSAQPVLAVGNSDWPGLDSELSTGSTTSGFDPETLQMFASLEKYSEHPLGKAAVEVARQEGVQLQDAVSVEVHKGQGITGDVDGSRVFAGNRYLLHRLGIWLDEDLDRAARLREAEGKTVSFVGWDSELRALAIFGDKLKEDAASAVEELKSRGVEVHLLSGDAAATTQWVASCLGTYRFEAQALPEDKVAIIKRLQQQGATVAMVGDGINDAPALAQADVGIAMGAGTDVAMKAAAIVLMNGSLHTISQCFSLSQRTLRVVKQNLFWAFLYNSVGIALAVVGVLNPIMAACAMLLSSTSVVGNSLRLRRNKEFASNP